MEQQDGLQTQQSDGAENQEKESSSEFPAAKKQKKIAFRSKSAGSPGFVGSAPSSLASLAKGKKYFIDPYTPLTPRPQELPIRDTIVGPPLATTRSNYWITQTSPAYIPKRLQNHRVPRTPPEIKKGFPAKDYPRAGDESGIPKFLVDAHGHLLPQFRKPGRGAFPNVESVGGVSWAFSRMGYV